MLAICMSSMTVKQLLNDGAEVSPDDVIEHCATRLAAYKRPRRVEFRADLPRTDAGKLYKRQIRDEYWTELGRRL